ncbi:hypothetical protein SASPL_139944 [Salvia splendens]|uniref:Pentatricopeptide repeat domain-containing protein 1 n=1 Tax=Salvia splendens TaxID=180675 RepID=A0A8X8WP36_SALSN|nr:hypothetical protein SASPL_139944 [Salvia splendens]
MVINRLPLQSGICKEVEISLMVLNTAMGVRFSFPDKCSQSKIGSLWCALQSDGRFLEVPPESLHPQHLNQALYSRSCENKIMSTEVARCTVLHSFFNTPVVQPMSTRNKPNKQLDSSNKCNLRLPGTPTEGRGGEVGGEAGGHLSMELGLERPCGASPPCHSAATSNPCGSGRGDWVEECLEVLRLLGEEGEVMSCLYFFEWIGLREPHLVTATACSVLFPLLGRARKGDELLVVFKNLPFKQNPHFRDVRVYNAAISGLMSCGRYNDAWTVYEMMEASNIRPDHVTSSIMITVMRKNGDSAEDAWKFFEKMNQKGIEWSLEAVGALIKLFCDEGLKKEALIIQSELEKKGISSNAVIYNTIMDAYGKSNHVEEAEGLLTEMKAKGVAPTAATYNILMDAYSRRMQPDIVEKLLEEMEAAGLEPNVRSYTCLISAYGRQKKMSDMAADAFLRMKRVGIKPSSHSYTALIHAYSVSGWHEKAYLAFDDMLREGIKPSIETYTALLDAFRRAGDTETLMKIWKLMIRDKVEGTRVTFNILVDGFAKQGQYVEARDVMHEFGKHGFHPTVMTYNMLMNAYARGGQESKLPQLLKEMAALNLKPDSVTYSTIIYAYVRVRDFSRAFYYHKQMVKNRQVPDAKSYEKLRAILNVKAKIKNRKDKSALMGIIKASAGLLKEKKKGKKDEFWKTKKGLRTPQSRPPQPSR